MEWLATIVKVYWGVSYMSLQYWLIIALYKDNLTIYHCYKMLSSTWYGIACCCGASYYASRRSLVNRSRGRSGQVPQPTCYWQLGNLTRGGGTYPEWTLIVELLSIYPIIHL